MPDFQPKPGSFLPFLEYSQRARQQGQSVAASPMALLAILARQVQQTLSLDDLQTLSGMDADRYRQALKSLRDAGYIAMQGDPLDPLIRLTEPGAEVVRLTKPA